MLKEKKTLRENLKICHRQLGGAAYFPLVFYF